MTVAAGDPVNAERLTSTVEHMVVYECLGALAMVSWSSLRTLPLVGRWRRVACAAWRWSVPLAICVAFCYGAFDEWHQGWVAGRTASMYDLVWDVIGGVAGTLAVLMLRSVYVRDGWLRRWAVAVDAA